MHDTGLQGPVPPGFTSIDPVYEYVHSSIPGGDAQYKGNSVCGGYVYRGSRFPELYGHYIRITSYNVCYTKLLRIIFTCRETFDDAFVIRHGKAVSDVLTV